jgi:hypothetical protein
MEHDGHDDVNFERFIEGFDAFRIYFDKPGPYSGHIYGILYRGVGRDQRSKLVLKGRGKLRDPKALLRAKIGQLDCRSP